MPQRQPLTIGLLSDTHVPHRLKRLPDTALDALAGVDLILHAGAVDDPAALKPLRDIAPVYTVRGNVHPQDFSDGGAALPAAIELQLALKSSKDIIYPARNDSSPNIHNETFCVLYWSN